MNKKLIALLLAIFVVVLAGCGKNAQEKNPTLATEPESGTAGMETEGQVPEETVLGVEDLESGVNNPFEETEATEGSGTQETEPKATEPEATQPEATKPEATEPEATKPESTEPESTEPEATAPNTDVNGVSYEDYINMSPEEQMAFFNQFDSMEDFVKWYNEAKAKYDEEHGSVDVGDGDIDMGDIVKP